MPPEWLCFVWNGTGKESFRTCEINNGLSRGSALNILNQRFSTHFCCGLRLVVRSAADILAD
jgi:hypothetical protein